MDERRGNRFFTFCHPVSACLKNTLLRQLRIGASLSMMGIENCCMDSYFISDTAIVCYSTQSEMICTGVDQENMSDVEQFFEQITLPPAARPCCEVK